jgi:hypothetical protein
MNICKVYFTSEKLNKIILPPQMQEEVIVKINRILFLVYTISILYYEIRGQIQARARE